MAGQRKKTKKKVKVFKQLKQALIEAKESEEMKTWAIQINALEDMPLTEWEQGFIASVSDWFISKGSRLSPLQAETLEKVYRKYF